MSPVSVLTVSAKLALSVSEVLVSANSNDPDQRNNQETNKWFNGPCVNVASCFIGACFNYFIDEICIKQMTVHASCTVPSISHSHSQSCANNAERYKVMSGYGGSVCLSNSQSEGQGKKEWYCNYK